MTTYTDIFTGSPVQPSDVGYAVYTLNADKTLEWPSTAATSDVVARIMSIACNGAFSLIMPAANQAATGQDSLITNTGASTLTIEDSTGGTITTIAAGTVKYIYLTDNTTIAGVWAAVAFGVGASNVDASALAGYGLLAVSTTLNQSCPVTTLSTSTTLTIADRARLNVDTVGITINLPSAAASGNNYFTFIRNGSSGTTTVAPSGGDLIDSASSISLNPSESIMLICSGLAWYTVGWGRAVDFNYTQLNKNVAGGSNVTLTAAEAGYKILKFTGLLTANINVVVPTTTTIWYIDNATTGAFTITVKTTSGTGIATAGGTRYILYGDGTNVTNAVTVTGSFSSFSAGSAASPSITFAADTDTGAYNTAANQFGIAAGGAQVANFTAGGLSVTGAITATAPFAVSSGGTGIASYTIGDILYASGTTAFTKLTAIATGNALITGGVGVAPSWGKIGLTTHISGILPVANGGTGLATLTANNVVLGNGSTSPTFVAPGTSGNVLTSNGATWTSSAASGFNGGTLTGDITMSGSSIIEAEGAAVASASSTGIWATDGNARHITGNTTINDFGTAPQAGARMRLIFDGTPLLTHSANLNLNNGSSNIQIEAGDYADVFADTTTQHDVIITRKSGQPIASTSSSVIVNYFTGGTMSTVGASSTMTIASWYGADSTNAVMMNLLASTDKTTASWAVGTATGGLDTGSIANSTWYHFFIIRRPDTGVVDVLFSLSATAPTLPASYTQFRRLGSGKTNGAGQWTLFTQKGNSFYWDVSVRDIAVTNPGTAAVTRTLASVPTGVVVMPIATYAESNITTNHYSLTTSLDQTNTAPSATAYTTNLNSGSTMWANTQIKVTTNTSAQVRTRQSASGVGDGLEIMIHGWEEIR